MKPFLESKPDIDAERRKLNPYEKNNHAQLRLVSMAR
jgi:hypothetical protein